MMIIKEESFDVHYDVLPIVQMNHQILYTFFFLCCVCYIPLLLRSLTMEMALLDTI